MILVLLGVLLPQLGTAGPWPRGEGNQFLSVSFETEFENGITDGDEFFGTLYYERGLTPDLTIGLDLGTDTSNVSKAFGFVRWPVGASDGPARRALEIGFGAFDETVAIRPALSWGRGITYGGIPGWISLDSRLVFKETFEGVLKNDFTFGLRPGPRGTLILQVQTSQQFQTSLGSQINQPILRDFFAKIAPSYVHEFRPGRRIEFGLISGISGTDDFQLKLGLWRDF